MTSSKPRPVAAYLRISKKDDRSTSIEKQRANIIAHAAREFPGAEVVEFTDDGRSASKGRTREGLDALLAALPSGGFAAVYVDTIDRLTRDRGSRVFWDVAEAVEKAGASLVGASQTIDLETSQGEMTASAMAMLARFEARRTSERVADTNRIRATKGLRALGGPAPWGFVRVGDSFRPCPERGPILLDAISRVIAGEAGIRTLAEEFTARGLLTGRGGSTWSHRGISKILRNPALAGMVPSGGDVLRGEDALPLVDEEAALVDLATWRALQSALDRRATPQTRVSKGLPLLHGLAVDEHGHRLYRHSVKGRRDRYTAREIGCPSKTSVDLEALDAFVSGEILDVVGDLPETRAVVVSEGRDAARLLALRAEIEKTAKALATADVAEIADLANRLTRLRQTEAAEGARSGSRLMALERTGRTLREAFEQAPDDDARRDVIAWQVSRVVVFPGQRGGQRRDLSDRVRIEWAEQAAEVAPGA